MLSIGGGGGGGYVVFWDRFYMGASFMAGRSCSTEVICRTRKKSNFPKKI